MSAGLGFLHIAPELWTMAFGAFALMISSGSAYLIARLRYRPDGKRAETDGKRAETERVVALREQDRLDFDAFQKRQPVGAILMSFELSLQEPSQEQPKRMILVIRILSKPGGPDPLWQVQNRQQQDHFLPVPCVKTKAA